MNLRSRTQKFPTVGQSPELPSAFAKAALLLGALGSGGRGGGITGGGFAAGAVYSDFSFLCLHKPPPCPGHHLWPTRTIWRKGAERASQHKTF